MDTKYGWVEPYAVTKKEGLHPRHPRFDGAFAIYRGSSFIKDGFMTRAEVDAEVNRLNADLVRRVEGR